MKGGTMTWEQRMIGLMVGSQTGLPQTADWPSIDHAARAHRLTPLLHYRAQEGAFDAPADLRRAWAVDYLRARQRSAAIATTTAGIAELLDGAAIPHVFLKGVHLAWSAYPDPALRTMRDIDLLIAADQVVAARDILSAHGFTPALFGVKDDEFALAQAKHLAPLIAPESGIAVELHHMLTDPAADLGRDIRFDPTPELLARRQFLSIGESRLAVLPREDMLLHILYHAAYDHFFNNGPQIIADIHFLSLNCAIDWPLFWAQAEAKSMAAGAALILGLVERAMGNNGTVPPRFAPDDSAIDHAARVMMRDNYADRVARTIDDLRAEASPRALAAAVRRKFANQGTIAANNAYLGTPGAHAESPVRSRLSALGDVVRHTLRDQRKDDALRALLRGD
jgi:hypothetical protein